MNGYYIYALYTQMVNSIVKNRLLPYTEPVLTYLMQCVHMMYDI